jgi:stage II sporulation protein D
MFIRKGAFLIIILLFCPVNSFSQFRIRLLSDMSPDVVIFTVTEGIYQINLPANKIIKITSGESVIMSRLNNRLAVKTRNENGFTCDSVELISVGADDSFSLRINSDASIKRIYNGNLICKSDMESVFIINVPDIEDYIAGVVKSEGGSGGSSGYYKTQAVIARTYSYKYEKKHIGDQYNLCDGVHCQVFGGIITDTMIIRAVKGTKGEVIVDRDSSLIIAAFHSNCGGETAASEDVWLTDQPYLKKVIDPYCLSSRNAVWEKKISVADWVKYLNRNGFTGTSANPSAFSFTQKARQVNYTTGIFKYPLRLLRNDFQLRSTYFSVVSDGDSLILKGRGYGHGVGLCQEGAMAMAKRGMNYEQIIRFYYTGVKVIDVTDVKKPVTDNSLY